MTVSVQELSYGASVLTLGAQGSNFWVTDDGFSQDQYMTYNVSSLKGNLGIFRATLRV